MATKNKPKPLVTVESLLEKDIPAGAQVMLFNKACELINIEFIENRLYEVTVPADIGEGNCVVPVSGEHEVLVGANTKSPEEIAAAKVKREEAKQEAEEAKAEAEKEKKAKADEDAREKSRLAAEERAKKQAEATTKP